MKKTILFLMVCLMTAGIAKAQLAVTVADVEALPGETVTFSLSFTGGQADTYTSLQFDLGLPDGITPTGIPTFSASWPGATGSVGTKGAFASSEVMAGTAIDNLVTVSLAVDANKAVGAYNVTLSNIQFRYGTQGLHDDAAGVTFKVNVVSVHTVVLDETSTTAPANANGVNVRVKRTINAGEWSTICLPFAMTTAQCQAAFGSDVQIGDFTGCTVVDDNITVNFSDVTAMAANHPYIIKVSSAVSEFTVDGVDIAAGDAEVKVNKSGRKYNWFIGNYENGTELEDGFLFLNANKFYFSNGSTKIKAYRGYFNLESADAYYESRRIILNFGDATGIETIVKDGADEVFNLSGQRVKTPAKGLYIMRSAEGRLQGKNGKKVVVK